MPQYYDRYSKFKANGVVKPLPGVYIKPLESDKTIVYRQGKGESRLDYLSDLYYTTPYCGWLILLANPQFGGLEFNIPDLSVIRVPFPFETAIDRYIEAINTHKKLYGE